MTSTTTRTTTTARTTGTTLTGPATSTAPDVPAVGVFLPTMSERDDVPGDVVAAARHAEALGFDSVWAVDQLVSGTGVPIVDSTVALSAAGRIGSRPSPGRRSPCRRADRPRGMRRRAEAR